MHETRNLVMVLLLIGSLLWSGLVWFVFGTDALALPAFQRAASLLLLVSMAVWLVYAFKFEDKLPDHLGEKIGEMYYGVDGVDFMPTIRSSKGRAELSIYYQNRFENPAEMIIHLRPPDDSFVIRPGMRDVHFAFKVGGGDFGVLHQPIAVPEHLQGEVIEVQLAAASYYPRSHGTCLRRHSAMPCGTLVVDWGGAAFRSGVHEVSGEVDLERPSTLHFSMPKGVAPFVDELASWRQECVHAGKRD